MANAWGPNLPVEFIVPDDLDALTAGLGAMVDVSAGDRAVDVAVVGFGPVGAAVAGLCARRGLDVVVLERDTEVFPLPRAVQIDHEGLRILQEIGCADEILAHSVLNDGLDFLTADRRTLMSATVPAVARTGWPSSVFFHQPTFESVLRSDRGRRGVDVRLGTGVEALDQDDDGVDVRLADGGIRPCPLRDRVRRGPVDDPQGHRDRIARTPASRSRGWWWIWS